MHHIVGRATNANSHALYSCKIVLYIAMHLINAWLLQNVMEVLCTLKIQHSLHFVQLVVADYYTQPFILP